MSADHQVYPDGQRGALRVPRVAIVGTGHVGATTAYALLMSGTVGEIVLINRNRRRAEGHANGMRDAAAFSQTAKVLVRDFADCHDADVTISTAGVGQSVNVRSRLDILQESAAIRVRYRVDRNAGQRGGLCPPSQE